MERVAFIPQGGFIFRNKTNPDDFSSELYLGEGRLLDEWEQVPISVYETYQKEQEEKSLEGMGINPVDSL